MTSPTPNAGGTGDAPDGVDSISQVPRPGTAAGEHMNQGQVSANHDIESSAYSSSSASTSLKENVAESGDARHGSPVQRYDSNAIIGTEDRTELVRIATALSRRRSSVAVQPQASKTLGAIDEYDTALDPEHGDFDLAKWIRRFIEQLQEQGLTERRTSVAFRKLDVFGSGSALQLQQTVGSVLAAPLRMGEFFSFGKKEPKQILRNFEGFLASGELLVVLGRPGSGCSTLLKTLCGELEGLELGQQSSVHYNGIPQRQMQREFKGEAVYNQEVDKHFPHLTVGQTLEFAASARTPSHRIQGMSRQEFCRYIARVVMASFGLSHTYNTKVGNDFVRGVSGGERKRVSIAEMVLAGSPISAWDNSTRGLDSATALKFVQSLRMACDFGSQANAVAIYQASQAIYDLFDKATVLYEGRQIYFGPASQAKRFFEEQGWYCPPRQTTGDFLTSVTNAQERKARDGMEQRVPRTPDEFAAYWHRSPEYQALQADIDAHEQVYLVEQQAETVAQFREQKNYRQAKHVRPGSPYLISIWMQIALNTKRAYQRMWNDISATLTQTVSQLVMALIIGSIFFGTPDASAGFYSKGSVLFMAVLMNALTAISEISSLYDQRPIVEKHHSYAFYHPATEAMAGIAADIPIKFVTSTVFNIVLYFMAGLRREPAQFFLYFLITYMSIFVMSAVFRTMAAATKTVSQALALSGVLVLALVIYTGFAIRVPEMHPWFSWIRWINPIFYAFEILIANEFHGREFTCSSIVPPYSPPRGDSWICQVAGAVAGRSTVSGDAFIAADYSYSYSHVWRNFGILCAFLVAFMTLYFITTELNSATSSTAEALVFQRGHVPEYLQKGNEKVVQEEGGAVGAAADERETKGSDVSNVGGLAPQNDIFTWSDIIYHVDIKGEQRQLLDHVSGWVKPGTLTALMGVSGAGKTTLLDVLAQRTTMGVITGDMLVNGKPLDPSFQRKTGYVQQQDLHLETATVRESLRFSALLRQPQSVSQEEKYGFVEEVIKMLNMEDFANAVVGVPGEGLNVEQRKLLTIGVELAAKPKLLLFLDEPTSGLDSQSSWAICAFLRKLADSGQAILCTIHQPSAILFQAFDRLLFLARGGKTVYFGDIGANSRTLLDYFESHGARRCGDDENPAEYMLEMVNAGTNDRGQDWHSVWGSSQEAEGVRAEMERIHAEKQQAADGDGDADSHEHAEFAMPFTTQLWVVSYRVLQQYWRMPNYIFAKFMLGIVAGLFIGFTFFNADGTQAGTQSVIFSVFMLTTLFSTLVQQIQPLFITQRSLYEVRERPSKAYSWKAFIIANIMVEIPYQIVTGIFIFACFYYPVVGVQSSERQGLVLLFIIQLLIFSSSFAHMTIVTMPDAHTAGSVVTILSIMSIIFSGVLQTPDALPGFWIFMYRVSPFSYWISGIVATELHDRPITCSAKETSIFNPPQGMSCAQYLAPLLQQAPGRLQNPDDMSQCRYCPVTNADQSLAASKILWSERWRNYGIFWAFIAFNVFTAVLLYYLFRVKRWNSKSSGLSKLLSRFKKTKKGES
ncbi:ABC-2 type transporter [Hirsutella rhossiliensis]|uniref:ABC-2 type transporter domain-containing protein n=1 Tax=Hirsutella rhossiliensis TaxID=111463 RepID=A0A9P8SE26_9HYPO|nr:ABC-2 type transporter domain-containing protein [Hirsutella rhossiliensis]KAH0957606.1 ABC-2 type transporter domain-containing protein [Hirsutella rhossiliensis]